MDKDKFNEFMDDEARRKLDEIIKTSIKNHFKQKFATFNGSSLRKKTDEELALWQSDHPIDTPQYIMALQEWNNRSISRQLKWVRFAAIVGPIATIIAALLGYYLGNIQSTSRQPIQAPPAIEQSNKVPSESKDVRPTTKKTGETPIEKKIK